MGDYCGRSKRYKKKSATQSLDFSLLEIARLTDTNLTLTPLEQSILIALLRLATEQSFWYDEENFDPALDAVDGLILKVMQGSEVTMDNGIVGEVKIWTSPTPPDKYLLCEGQILSNVDYPDLFAVIGYAFGTGVYSYQFKLPDLQTRVVVGRGAPPNANSTSKTLATSGGEERVTLVTSQIPSHTHGQRGNSGGAGAVRTAGVTGGGDINHASSTQATGGGESHNNMPPYIVLQYIIKVLP